MATQLPVARRRCAKPALRVVPMGRKHWSFCWTELGAKHVGIIQSLIVICRLHGLEAASSDRSKMPDVLER